MEQSNAREGMAMTVKRVFTAEKKEINPIDTRKNGTMECEKGKRR